MSYYREIFTQRTSLNYAWFEVFIAPLMKIRFSWDKMQFECKIRTCRGRLLPLSSRLFGTETTSFFEATETNYQLPRRNISERLWCFLNKFPENFEYALLDLTSQSVYSFGKNRNACHALLNTVRLCLWMSVQKSGVAIICVHCD